MKNVVVFSGNDCVKEREEYYYGLARRTGRLLAEGGFVTVTGGGPGLMDETMRGAWDAGGRTVAVCLEVEGRKHTEFATEKTVYKVLNQRQDKLISMGDAYLSLPGGVGTLYEIFAVLALKRKAEILDDKPLILVGEYYEKLKVFLDSMVSEGFIGANLDSYYRIVKSPEDAVGILKGVGK